MTKEITAALCKFLSEVPSLTSMTTAKIQTQSGKGFEFDFAELGYICSVINPILSANGLHIYHYDEYIDGQEILASTIYHVSGECLPTSRKLIPKGVNKNPLYEYGSAKTYFRRYVTLGMLNLWHGVDDAGKEYNPNLEEIKVTPINKNKAVGMPTILDEDTKKYYLKLVGDLIVKDNKLYNTLADALYIEFDFDRNTNLSQNITKPKHVTFIEEWLSANQ
tara:strand:- start:498 stop:1160 length:663 start_codon:yes stop_codon:yes gene_type:complete